MFVQRIYCLWETIIANHMHYIWYFKLIMNSTHEKTYVNYSISWPNNLWWCRTKQKRFLVELKNLNVECEMNCDYITLAGVKLNNLGHQWLLVHSIFPINNLYTESGIFLLCVVSAFYSLSTNVILLLYFFLLISPGSLILT